MASGQTTRRGLICLKGDATGAPSLCTHPQAVLCFKMVMGVPGQRWLPLNSVIHTPPPALLLPHCKNLCATGIRRHSCPPDTMDPE